MATTYNASGQLAEAINYLKYKGVIKTQKDVAEKMKATPSNVSVRRTLRQRKNPYVKVPQAVQRRFRERIQSLVALVRRGRNA